ncbi:hypothetical protein [Priestia endophytica]|nr:hypothetical protein [Priestia endophytica]
MNYGENNKLVEEVMDFIGKEKMFENRNFNINRLETINGFDKAQDK